MIVDVVFGFLGSGKTTFIAKVLETWGENEKIVVLVNEFGEVGIDGDILSSQGGTVVEMPSGCICCTLQSDFRNQIFEIGRSFHPDRIIIEPSGVATINTIDWILKAQMLEALIKNVNKILLIDVTGFKSLYKANRRFVESQIQGAHLILLNKCDRVDKRNALLTQSAISSINPDVLVVMTEFGAVNWEEYNYALSGSMRAKRPMGSGEGKTSSVAAPGGHAQAQPTSGGCIGEERPIEHFHETEAALGYESFGTVYEKTVFNADRLQQLFHELNTPRSGLGEIVRAKGIFCLGEKWMVIEQASGEVSFQPIRPLKQSKVTIIGKDLNNTAIHEALDRCRAAGA